MFQKIAFAVGAHAASDATVPVARADARQLGAEVHFSTCTGVPCIPRPPRVCGLAPEAFSQDH
jgi:hypothetical protein